MNTLENNLTTDYFIGKTPEILAIKQKLKNIAKTDVPIFLKGETGTGKEVAANYIYQHSLRNEKSFLTVNCAGITETLIESELFGHKKGAFTGANYDKQGYFETTNYGTLFLDEITELPKAHIAKLLRVIEYGSFLKVGGSKETKVDVRVIAAGSDPEEMLKEFKQFKYRFRDIIPLPALRDRKDDIPLLSDYFLKMFNEKYKMEVSLSEAKLTEFLNHDWPGNVRELMGAIEMLVIDEGVPLQRKSLNPISPIVRGYKKYEVYQEENPKNIDLYGTLKNIEISLIKRALEKAPLWGGKPDISKTAESLGIKRTNLSQKMKKYGIEY